jgi:2-polyprenyl-3-methyl-5-hydroxy-6-metoxy-1,4-benzoquinol methylase
MVEINSKDYRDYYIKDGKLIGEFEQCYQKIDDPWDVGDALDITYNITLGVIESFYKAGQKLLDLSCGKGVFTKRIKDRCQCYTVGSDISKTACRKASISYPDITFIPYDLLKFEQCPFKEEQFDIILLNKVLWGLIPRLSEIMRFVPYLIRQGGYLIISQHLFHPANQTYGKDVLSTVQDLEKMISIKKELLIEFMLGVNPYIILVSQK